MYSTNTPTDGAGKIARQDNGSQITVFVNTTLTNDTTIEGLLDQRRGHFVVGCRR